MAYPLIDDVRELLEKGKGDERILNQILRACENDEVISNYERSYVRKLVEKHLNKTDIGPVESAPPDVKIIPQTPAAKKVAALVPPTSRSSTKNIKVVIGIGAALIIAVAVSVAMSGPSDKPIDDPINPIDPPPDLEPTALLIQTDLQSYQKGDLISINGSSAIPGSANLYITNSNDQIVWSERVAIKEGRYSTLAIAGGSGWEDPGTFTIKADNGTDSVSMNFSFTG